MINQKNYKHKKNGGVYIPRYVWDMDLTLSELKVYEELYYWNSQSQNPYYKSKQSIAEELNIHPKTVQKVLNKFKKLGLVEFAHSYTKQGKEVRVIRVVHGGLVMEKGGSETAPGGAKRLQQGESNDSRGGSETAPHNNIYNNNINNNIKPENEIFEPPIKKQKYEEVFDRLPKEQQTDEVKKLIKAWVAHLRDCGKKWSKQMTTRQANQIAKIKPELLPQSIEYSIANGWQMVYEKSLSGGQNKALNGNRRKTRADLEFEAMARETFSPEEAEQRIEEYYKN